MVFFIILLFQCIPITCTCICMWMNAYYLWFWCFLCLKFKEIKRKFSTCMSMHVDWYICFIFVLYFFINIICKWWLIPLFLWFPTSISHIYKNGHFQAILLSFYCMCFYFIVFMIKNYIKNFCALSSRMNKSFVFTWSWCWIFVLIYWQ